MENRKKLEFDQYTGMDDKAELWWKKSILQVTPLIWNKFDFSHFNMAPFFFFSCAENMVRVIEGKIIYNWPESKKWVGVNLLKSKILSITCLSEEVCCAESAVTSIKFAYNSPTCMCHPQFFALNSFSTVLNFTIPRVGICTVNTVSFLRLMIFKDLNKRKQ